MPLEFDTPHLFVYLACVVWSVGVNEGMYVGEGEGGHGVHL